MKGASVDPKLAMNNSVMRASPSVATNTATNRTAARTGRSERGLDPSFLVKVSAVAENAKTKRKVVTTLKTITV